MKYSTIQDMKPPRTARVYLQPPLSERLILLFPDFKITDLELSNEKGHTDQDAAGFLILHGKNMESPNYQEAYFTPVEGGYPIYTINEGGDTGTHISMQAFSSFARVPVTYARITVTNNNNYAIEDALGILPRFSTNDCTMIGCNNTGYSIYRPNFRFWLTFFSRFKTEGNRASDGNCTLVLKDSGWHWVSRQEQPVKHEAYDYFRTDFRLEPGESVHFDLCFTTGEAPDDFDYDTELRSVRTAWEKELAPLDRTPSVQSSRIQAMFRHLAAQSLQMLARYEGSDLITPRQGDIGRYVWPWEAAYLLTGLDRIGLTKYTGDAYRYFIKEWMVTEGEDTGKIMSSHQQWGNLNGSLLWGISQHLLYTKDKAEFESFKPALEMMLKWVEMERQLSVDDPDSKFKHIFPVGKGCDWRQLAQHWCFTDSQNVMGEECMARAYEFFGDEKAAWVRSCADDYRAVMLGIMQDQYAGHENDESFMLPHHLDLPFEETLGYCYYTAGAPFLLVTGIMDPNSKIFEQMEAYFDECDLFKLGLAGRMTSSAVGDYGLYGDVYYTVNCEAIWIEAWLKRGEKEKAETMMRSLMRYGITSEFVVSERYTPLEEWYSPWQPNASSSGRMIHLLLDYYGEQMNGN